jgi:flagellar biosynthetic protein FliP
MDELFQVADRLRERGSFTNLQSPLELGLFLGALAFASLALVMLTSFTRTVIVLSFVRRALTTPEIPPNPVLIGLALFLTYFVMAPTLSAIAEQGLGPYLRGEINARTAWERGVKPLKQFMLKQTRQRDLALFLHIAALPDPATPEDTPMQALVPAFVISELKTAFLMGFIIYLPFLMVDLVVSSVLMSLGMLMLPPVVVSTPFKILLFVLVDGWYLIAQALAISFV